MDYISEELLRLREAKKFTYAKLSNYLKAWEHELHTEIGRSQLFKNSRSDTVKIRICSMVLKDIRCVASLLAWVGSLLLW